MSQNNLKVEWSLENANMNIRGKNAFMSSGIQKKKKNLILSKTSFTNKFLFNLVFRHF